MAKQEDLNALIQNRMEKVDALRERGENPYRNDFKPTHTTQEVRAFFYTGKQDDEGKPVLREGRTLSNEPSEEEFSIAGRIVLRRPMGKAAFAQIRDRDGVLQVYIRKDAVGADVFQHFKLSDLGDIVGLKGKAFVTKTGELTLRATEFAILTKSTRPMPDKHAGLRDTETRYRQRYLDLISNEESRETFRKRSLIVRAIRNYLDNMDFLEVETPMMHPLIGGAAARPFVTHHNSLDRQLYLRIAPELYLKRLVVGGFERVYEINRNFRNEGISIKHNPEFTMLEFYMAYATYEDLIRLTEDLISKVVEQVMGSTQVTYQGTKLEFAAPWQRLTMKEAIVKYWNETRAQKDGGETLAPATLDEASSLDTFLRTHFPPAEGEDNYDAMEYGEKIGFLFEVIAEEHLIQPTFITGYPAAISPLARRNEQDPELTDRFEFFVYGRELGNAFSELNDPVDQRQRFEKQMEKKAAGAEETMDYDADYICALEHGMPPTAGEGIGIDRLCMFLCDAASIRDVILFPQLKH